MPDFFFTQQQFHQASDMFALLYTGRVCLLFSICGRRDCNVFSHRCFSVPDLEPNSTAYGSSCKLLLKCHGLCGDQGLDSAIEIIQRNTKNNLVGLADMAQN